MAAAHVKYLKSMVDEDLPKVEQLCGKQISPRPSLVKMSSISKLSGGGGNSDGAVSRILKETIVNPATGKPMEVSKIFVVTPENLPYQDVGWVHRQGIDRCMVCNGAFGLLNRKHNCFACGYVVCNSCSNREAQIDQLQSPRLNKQENNGKYRVCKRCSKGAAKVSATMTPRAYQLATMNQTPSHNNRIFFPGEEEEDEDEADRETETDRAATPPQRSSSDNDNASLNTTNMLEPTVTLPPRPPRPDAPIVPKLSLKLDTDVETVSVPLTKPPVHPVVDKEKAVHPVVDKETEKERSPPKRLLIPTDSEVNMVERAALSQAAAVHTSAAVTVAPTRVSPSNTASSAPAESTTTTSQPPSPPGMTHVATPQPPPAQAPSLPLRSPVHAYIHRVPGSATNKARVNNGFGKSSPPVQTHRAVREDGGEIKEAPARQLLHGDLVTDNDTDDAVLTAYANQNKQNDQAVQEDANSIRFVTCAVDETCVIS